MGALDWVVLGLVAAAFVFAVVRSIRRKGTCCGNCASCGRHCSSDRKESPHP